jgi:hypothetical protein
MAKKKTKSKDKTNSDLKDWKLRKATADRAFKDKAESQIKLYRRYYRNDQWTEGTSGRYRDRIVVNMVFSNIKTIMPSINLRRPKYFVSAKKKPHQLPGGEVFDTNQAANATEILINYYFNEIQMKKEADKVLLDALLGPWGVMQFGYTLKTEKIQNGKLIETNELMGAEAPFAIRRSPLDLRVDPMATDHQLGDAGWIALRWVRPLASVKADPKYSNTSGLKANWSMVKEAERKSILTTVSPTDDNIDSSAVFDMVEGWDIWDKENGRLMTLVEGHNNWLQDRDWPLEYENFPVETLYFNENPDELFPVSDVEIYIHEQDELNRLRSLALTHTQNISERKYLTRKGAFEDDDLEQVLHGGDGATAEVAGDPTTAMWPIKDAMVSQDIYINSRQVQEDIRMESGVGGFEQGGVRNFDTATEPALIQQGINIRRDERTGLLEDFYIRGAKQLGQILQQTLRKTSVPLDEDAFRSAQERSRSLLEKITSAEDVVVLRPWLNLSKEDIQGEFEFNMEVGSTKPINQEQRKADAVGGKQLLGESPNIDQWEMDKRVLEAFEAKDIDKLLKPKEQVGQEQQAAQQAALQAEIAKDQPKRETDMAKTQAKNETSKEIAAGKNRTGLLVALASKDSGNGDKK